jgi:uncharacterized protein YecE (DUF72 family)
MRKLFVGTSGFAFKEWKGSFYPKDLPDARMLDYYGERLGAVEINNTFYRMPKVSVLQDWASRVPAGFRFVLKASRQITHMTRLKEPQPVEYLLKNSAALEEKRGPILFQLPPNMKKDVERLRNFLSWIPAEARAALEFRHESWHDEEVFAALRAKNAALCISQVDGDEEGALNTPFVATADWSYLRLRKQSYAPGELEEWAARIHQPGWGDVFVFFKHEDEGTGPKLAKQFEAIAAPAT